MSKSTNFGIARRLKPKKVANRKAPDKKKTFRTLQSSSKGTYQLSFVESYDNLTEKDAALKLEYAKSLLTKRLGISRELIQLQKVKETMQLAAVDYVYYVRQGKLLIGKLSIQVARVQGHVRMYFIYKNKTSLMGSGKKR